MLGFPDIAQQPGMNVKIFKSHHSTCITIANGPHFEARTRPNLESARARHLFLKPDLGPKAKFTE